MDPHLPQTSRGDVTGSVDARRSRRGCCGSGLSCGRCILILLPTLGCTLILGSLVLLVYRLGMPITDFSISKGLADYDTVGAKAEVLVVILAGGTLMFIVALMRNIQISVYDRRQRTESKGMKIANAIAAVSAILAYVGFCVLALFDADGPSQSPMIHNVGTYAYFIPSGVYALLHIYLLCKQTHYPLFCKIIFAIFPIPTIACCVIYATDNSKYCEFEWYAVALVAINVSLVSILFLVDPVDDDLRDFFCCRVRRGAGVDGSRRNSTNTNK